MTWTKRGDLPSKTGNYWELSYNMDGFPCLATVKVHEFDDELYIMNQVNSLETKAGWGWRWKEIPRPELPGDLDYT